VKGLFGIAVRNLFRAKRRNLLSGGTMVLGSGALVLGSGLADGIERQLTANLVAVQTGHVQVVVRPADFHPQNSPFDAYGVERVPDAESLARRLEAEGRDAGVVRAVPYLYGRGTAVAGNRSSLASVIGVLPAREPEVQAAFPAEAGTFVPEGDDLAVAVLAPVARKLRLQTGDTVSFVIQTPDGAVNSLDLVVCGILRKNAPWYDNAFFVSLPTAQRLFDWPGAATNVKVTLEDGTPAGARRARPDLAAIVGAPSGLPREGRLRVETYDEAGRFSFAIMQANETALTVLSSFLFAAAAVGIANSMLMSVHERTREIGTIRALGMRRRLVVRLFLLEGLALGLASAAVGVAIAGALVLHWGRQGIPMNNMTLAWMAGGDALFPVLTAGSVARAVVSIALLSTLAAVYPAFTASRLEPREALHHT
jgi:putative ABC transport system permease protein